MNSKRLLRIALLLVLAAGIALAIVYRDVFDAEALERWVDQAGAAGPIIFLLIYIAGTVLFLPGSVLTLAGGALFGPVFGTFLNLTGATIGATIAFLIARYLAGDWVEKKSAGRLKQLKEGVEAEGWKFVAFVRLVPLFPFNLLNYALGLTRIKAWHYFIASYVFMLPGGLAYTYLGYAGREAIAGGEGLIQKGLLALALLAGVAFLPRLIARLRSRPTIDATQLKAMIDAGDNMTVLDVRTEEDFKGPLGHIQQAQNIPLESLDKSLNKLEDFNQTIALVCTTDRRSAKAARMLTAQGYSDVHVVRGGMTDWTRMGYPVS